MGELHTPPGPGSSPHGLSAEEIIADHLITNPTRHRDATAVTGLLATAAPNAGDESQTQQPWTQDTTAASP